MTLRLKLNDTLMTYTSGPKLVLTKLCLAVSMIPIYNLK